MKSFPRVSSLLISTLLFSSASIAASAWKGTSMPVLRIIPGSWTGFYAGLNVGAVSNTMDITDNQATTFNATIREPSNPSFTGGFQAGYRRQLSLSSGTAGVYGLEFSANFSNTDFSKDYGSPFALYQISSKNDLKNVCLLQLTGGLAAEKTLIFLAAGMSWTHITGSLTDQDSITFFNGVNLDKKVFGTALGGGVEYAYSDKISIRFKADLITPNAYTANDGSGDSFLISNSILQGTLGVNYKFG